MKTKPRSLTLLIWVATMVMLPPLVGGCRRGDKGLKSSPSVLWNVKLHNRLQGVTRVRIRSLSMSHRMHSRESTLHDERSPGSIRELLRLLVVDPRRSGGSSMCCGSLSLEFYRGTQLVVTLSLHRATSLRWRQGWPGDGGLFPAKAEALVAWLAAHGATSPSLEKKWQNSRASRAEEKAARATQGLSPALQKAYRKGAEAFGTLLAMAYPDAQHRVAILFRVLGTSNGSWSQLDWQDQLADGLLRKYPGSVLRRACKTALLGEDRQARRGAARFWYSYRSPLASWQPSQAAKLHDITLGIMQQSRYYPLRIQALQHLSNRRTLVPTAVIGVRLKKGLHDPHIAVRRQAMLTAAALRHNPSKVYLLKILKGGLAETTPLPDVPASELVDVPEGFDQVANKATPSEVSALALGHLGAKEAIQVIERIHRQTPSPMYRVALALLGRPQLLKAGDFNTRGKNQALQLAAVEAVLRVQGRHGLAQAVGYRLATDGGETRLVVTKLKTMLLKNGAPGHAQLKDARRPIDLKRWYQQHGEEYLYQLEHNRKRRGQ